MGICTSSEAEDLPRTRPSEAEGLSPPWSHAEVNDPVHGPKKVDSQRKASVTNLDELADRIQELGDMQLSESHSEGDEGKAYGTVVDKGGKDGCLGEPGSMSSEGSSADSGPTRSVQVQCPSGRERHRPVDAPADSPRNANSSYGGAGGEEEDPDPTEINIGGAPRHGRTNACDAPDSSPISPRGQEAVADGAAPDLQSLDDGGAAAAAAPAAAQEGARVQVVPRLPLSVLKRTPREHRGKGQSEETQGEEQEEARVVPASERTNMGDMGTGSFSEAVTVLDDLEAVVSARSHGPMPLSATGALNVNRSHRAAVSARALDSPPIANSSYGGAGGEEEDPNPPKPAAPAAAQEGAQVRVVSPSRVGGQGGWGQMKGRERDAIRRHIERNQKTPRQQLLDLLGQTPRPKTPRPETPRPRSTPCPTTPCPKTPRPAPGFLSASPALTPADPHRVLQAPDNGGAAAVPAAAQEGARAPGRTPRKSPRLQSTQRHRRQFVAQTLSSLDVSVAGSSSAVLVPVSDAEAGIVTAAFLEDGLKDQSGVSVVSVASVLRVASNLMHPSALEATGKGHRLVAAFHGLTTVPNRKTVEKIAENGLDPGKCRAAMYGKGAYVATKGEKAYMYATISKWERRHGQSFEKHSLPLVVFAGLLSVPNFRVGARGEEHSCITADSPKNPTQFCVPSELRHNLLLTHVLYLGVGGGQR